MSTRKPGFGADLGQVVLTPHFVLLAGLLSLLKLYFMRISQWIFKG